MTHWSPGEASASPCAAKAAATAHHTSLLCSSPFLTNRLLFKRLSCSAPLNPRKRVNLRSLLLCFAARCGSVFPYARCCHRCLSQAMCGDHCSFQMSLPPLPKTDCFVGFVCLFVCFIFCPILLYIDDHEEARDGKMRLEGNGGYEHINSSCNTKPSAIEYATIKSRAPFTLSFFSQ